MLNPQTSVAQVINVVKCLKKRYKLIDQTVENAATCLVTNLECKDAEVGENVCSKQLLDKLSHIFAKIIKNPHTA